MSAEKDVCRLMLTFANEKFPDKGLSSFMQLENLPVLVAPGFELVNRGAERNNASLATVPTSSAVFDINNDGRLDWVVKSEWTLSSQYSDRLDIYVDRGESLQFEGGLDSKGLDRADQHLMLTGRRYSLKKISPRKTKRGTSTEYSIGGVFKLIPFRFKNTTYIFMATPGAAPEVLPGRRKFSVVAKYSPAFELQDICYLEEARD